MLEIYVLGGFVYGNGVFTLYVLLLTNSTALSNDISFSSYINRLPSFLILTKYSSADGGGGGGGN